MSGARRVAGRAAAAAVVTMVAAGLPATSGSAATEGMTAVVSGTLLVALANDDEGGTPPAYAVQTEDGTLIPIAGSFDEHEDAGDHFRGTVRLTGLPGVTVTQRLRAAPLASTPLAVESYTLTATVEPAAVGTSHRWFVAIPSNFGPPGMSDAALLAKLEWVASYWERESNGAIADNAVIGGLTRYTATATSEAAGCGLVGGDFFSTVYEADNAFPTADFTGSDQLIVLVPPTCASGGTVGRATIGSLSFARGGYSISKADPDVFEWTLAHELGHNYGYGHSSLGPCSPACTSTYGDYYSVMGGVISGRPLPPALGTVSRQLQGVTTGGESETVTSSVTRTLVPRSAASGLRSLRVTDPSSGQVLQLDYRSGTGSDAGSHYTYGTSVSSFRKGVTVESVNGSNAIQLLPGPSSRKAMVAGDTLTLGTTTISIISMDTEGAVVSVTLPGGVPAYPTPGSVSLSGAPVAGSSVSAELSGWAPVPDSVTYQWLSNGTAISGATAVSYTPPAAQAGTQLSVRAVARKAGYQDATVTSAAQTVSASAITLIGAAAVTGTPQVGQALTCLPPSWQQPPPSVTIDFAWRGDGATITGADEPVFVVGAAQLRATVSCRVTLRASGYADAVSTSTASEPVAKGTLTSTKPVITGQPRVGRTLTAVTGAWTDGVELRYRWFVGGERARGQRGQAFTVKAHMVGEKIKVVVVGKLAGYATASRQSLGVGPVSPA